MNSGALGKRFAGPLLTLLAALTSIASAAQAQSAPSPYTSATRYDAAGRVTGTIFAGP